MEKLNLTELQYVLFDWDNTLAESRTALVATVNQVLSEYGLPSWEVSSRKRDRNLSFRDNFPNIFGPEKAAEAFLALPYEKKREMGQRGREYVEKRFDRNLVVNAYLEELKAAEAPGKRG